MNFFSKKNIYTIAKIIIALSAYIYIYFKLKGFDFNINLKSSNLYLLIIAVLLLFDNWGVESIKWQYLVKKYEKISLFKAYKSVFSGVTSSVFTPNRVGEFVGRMFYISDENKGKAVLSTIVGSFSQMLITLILGTITFFISESIVINNIEINSNIFNIALVCITSFLVFFYFNIGLFSSIIKKISFLKKYSNLFKSLELYSTKNLFNILLLSFLRYLVFALQFVLIVYFFELNVSINSLLIGLVQFYLVLLIVPTISISEPVVRVIIAMQVFPQYIINSPNLNHDIEIIIYSISLLWLINIVVPALIGSVLLFLENNKNTKV